jgi:deoxyhypusine synthase
MREFKRAIKHLKIEPTISVDLLLKEMEGCAFGAYRLSKAANIYEEMLRDKQVKKFFGLAGALVPAGLKQVIVDLIKHGYIDVLVTTGANLVHDLIEAFGGVHYKGSSTANDKALYEAGISRIYDVYSPIEHFELLEKKLGEILSDIKKQEVSSRELLYEIGLKLKAENSILRAAAESKIPVFSPGLADSIIGLHTSLRSKITLNPLKDIREIAETCFTSSKNGALFIGGGLPKNFILQSMLMSPNYINYAIQITMDRPEHGGLSGATLEEAISWGKIASDAKLVTVYCDATIALPLIVAAVRTRIER